MALRLLALLALTAISVRADLLESHSFGAPFDDINNQGDRVIGQSWLKAGTASVNQNFVRLTSDRQSKRGAVWSRRNLGTDTFSTVAKFRISGQGKKFFGDGIAFWFIHQGFWSEGDFHGSQEKFTGVGVIVDTFKNTESGSAHKDVSIVINDGTKDRDTMMENVVGCDGKLRYHEDDASFSAGSSASRIKMTVEKKKLNVYIDETNSGEWTECASVDVKGLNPNWARKAHIGITASTGQLADNHDLLSIETYTDLAKHIEDEEASQNEPILSRGRGMNQARFTTIEDAVEALMVELDELQHQFEFELESIDDHIRNTLTKLQGQEDQSEKRIDQLEEKVFQSVEGTLDERINKLENTMEKTLLRRLNKVEKSLNIKIDGAVEEGVASAGSWKLPFLILIVIFAAAAFGLYRWYVQLKKTHML